MSLSFTASTPILDYLFGGTSFSNPSTFYIGLSTTTIQNNGSGATEPSTGAYSRVSLSNNKTTWAAAANGTLSNLITIAFPESTLSWGTITYVFLASGGTTGINDIWWFEALGTPKTVAAQTTVSFAPSAITVSMIN